jgi:hypothetical protein
MPFTLPFVLLPVNPCRLFVLRAWAGLAVLCGGLLLSGCAGSAPAAYQPRLGQAGKDVMWLPTRDNLLARMLQVAAVGPDDLLADLGAGDGKILIAAARDHGARALGVEFDPRLARLARENAERAGVAQRVQVIEGDIFKTDFSQATVVSLYLLEELNQQLRPTLLAMKPGTRIVSNTFSMGDWEPDQVIEAAHLKAYYWKVPARVEGRWSVPGLGGEASAVLNLVQRHQRVAGTLSMAGTTQPLLGVQLDGAQLAFSFVDRDGRLQPVRARVEATRLQGEVLAPYGSHDVPTAPVPFEGIRVEGARVEGPR